MKTTKQISLPLANGSTTEQVHSAILEVETFPKYEAIENGTIYSLSLSNKTNPLTHGIHRFAAKYIPQVPRWAINEFGNQDSVVLDPFMGSGTTLVEAKQICQTAYGIDIDPLARLIAKVKTTRIPIEEIEEHYRLFESALATDSETLIVPMHDVRNFGHWFTRDAWSALQSIKSTILKLNCSADVRDFYLCIFSSIVRLTSNADDQSQKTYVSGTLKKELPSVRELFWRKTRQAAERVSSIIGSPNSETAVHILEGNAQSISLPNESVDLVVTSPPYLDSVDYMYNFMLEYFWLGDQLGINSRAEFNAYKKKSTGSKNPSSSTMKLPVELEELLSVENLPDYRKKAVPAYFEQMERHFCEISRVLRTGGKYVLVVGNSKTGDSTIPVHDCLIRLAHKHGLRMDKAFGYRIRRHYMKFPRKGRGGIILIDWVIVLTRTMSVGDIPSPLPQPNISLGVDDVAN